MNANQKRSELRSVAVHLMGVLAASLLIALNLKSFIQAGDLFPGGFTGLTRLIQRSAQEFWGVTLPFAPINLFFNAIPAVISYKLVGKRFTVYSCMVIAISSVLTDLLPSIDLTEDVLLVSVFGGLISGLASGVALKAGMTCGGTDFIAIPLAERKNVDAWNYILCGNMVMLSVAGMLFGWDKALYSIIYQFTTTQVVRIMDPDSQRATLFIVTGREQAGGVCAQIQDTHHSATLLEGVGLYNGEPCVMIYSVVSYSQIRSLTRKVRQADPNAFVNVMRTDKLMGNFHRNPRS